MAENSWNFYKANTSDTAQGVQGTHSSLSNPLNSATGSVYYRDFNSNTGPIKAVLTGSNFQDLDGSKAISMRAYVRMPSANGGSDVHKHFVFLAKTDTGNPDSSPISDWPRTYAYKIGMAHISFTNGRIDAVYGSGNASSINSLATSQFSPGQWVHLRADIIPVYTGTNITSDEMKLFKSTDNGETWVQIGNTISVPIYGSTYWNSYANTSTNNILYGFQTWGCYVDNFEVYLSTSFS